MKKLITCPDCQLNGIKQNLAEVLDTGMISVQRIRRGIPGMSQKDHTIIGGDNLFIICGNCGETVYRKEA